MVEMVPRIWKARTDLTTGGLPRQPFHIKVIPLIALLLLALVGWLVYHTVEKAMKEDMTSDLETVVKADVSAIRLWTRAQCLATEQIALDEETHALCLGLVAQSQQPPERQYAAVTWQNLEHLRDLFEPRLEANGYAAFTVLRTDGICVARSTDEGIGSKLWNLAPEYAEKLAKGQSVLTRPFLSSAAEGTSEQPVQRHPAISILTPLRDAKGTTVGTVAVRMKAAEALNSPLEVAQRGQSGESFAFDSNGRMISQSRFEAQLEEVGLLSPGESSVLGLLLKDPGINRLESARSPVGRDEQPLMHAVQRAIKQHRGEAAVEIAADVEGHRDYRGIPVVSAWIWLPDLNFGVATKLDVAEAYRPLYVLRYAFFCVFALLVLAVTGVLVASRIIQKKNQRILKAMATIQRLGQYTLDVQIGSGGMGAVYRASHAMLRRPTAIKIMQSQMARTPEDVARFEREVQLTSELTHPNTITIYDFGRTPDGLLYYAMEYLDGADLHTLVGVTGPLPEGRVIYLLLQVCASLSEAHGRALVHRDIKPANLMVCKYGGEFDFIKVLDFGLVKPLRSAKGPDAVLTTRGSTIGTPRYMSPEALLPDGVVDARSDIYSLGAVAYFLLAGTDVFPSDSVYEIASQHVNREVELPSRKLGRPIASDLESTIMKCLAKSAGQRWQTAAELAQALAGCGDSGTWTQDQARRWWSENDSRIRPARAQGRPLHCPPQD